MIEINNLESRIDIVIGNEKITKSMLVDISRDAVQLLMLEAEHPDSRIVNKLIDGLTPVNKKVAIAYFRHFLAFHILTDEEGSFLSFGGKDKKQWDKKKEAAEEMLADPHQNIWTWADRNIEVAPKPMDFAKLNQAMGQLIKKANKAKLGSQSVVQAMLSNGITVEDLLAVINAQADAPVAAE